VGFRHRDLHQSLAVGYRRRWRADLGRNLAARPAIESLVLTRTHLSSASGACTLASTDVPAIAEHGDGPYLRFIATFTCPPGPLRSIIPAGSRSTRRHRALLEFQRADGTRAQAILARQRVAVGGNRVPALLISRAS
jgi:hypothetical protein